MKIVVLSMKANYVETRLHKHMKNDGLGDLICALKLFKSNVQYQWCHLW